MSNIFQWHQKHWRENDGYLNEAIENFNDLVDNILSPSVHKIICTKPLNYFMDDKFEDNIIISDLSRGESIKDEKLIHTKLTSIIDSGSYIYWNDEAWIVLNEENNTVQSHKTFIIRKCAIDVNIMLEGTQYTYPVYVQNLALYADGAKELVHLTVSSAKFSIMIAENDVTNTIDIGTKFVIKGRAFETSLIDDLTIKNVRILTICETVASTYDDLENDIAYNTNSGEVLINPNLVIVGENVVLIGDTVEYTLPSAKEWLLEGSRGLKIILNEEGRCKVKCDSDNAFIGQVANLQALNDIGKAIDIKTIRIGGFF